MGADMSAQEILAGMTAQAKIALATNHAIQLDQFPKDKSLLTAWHASTDKKLTSLLDNIRYANLDNIRYANLDNIRYANVVKQRRL